MAAAVVVVMMARSTFDEGLLAFLVLALHGRVRSSRAGAGSIAWSIVPHGLCFIFLSAPALDLLAFYFKFFTSAVMSAMKGAPPHVLPSSNIQNGYQRSKQQAYISSPWLVLYVK